MGFAHANRPNLRYYAYSIETVGLISPQLHQKIRKNSVFKKLDAKTYVYYRQKYAVSYKKFAIMVTYTPKE